jgi:hypothetical protein
MTAVSSKKLVPTLHKKLHCITSQQTLIFHDCEKLKPHTLNFIFNCTAGILNSHQLYKIYIKPYAYRYRVRSSISTSIESCSMCKSSRFIRNLTKPSFKTEREENIMSQVKWKNYTAVACVHVHE